MSFFSRQGCGQGLFWAVVAMAVVSGARTGQTQGYDTAYVPFVVNIDATINATDGINQIQVATANKEATLHIPLQKTDGIRFFGTQRRATTMTIIRNRNGKVTVSLPAQSHKTAEVLLYTINGKLILRNNAAVSNVGNNLTCPNLATGVYILSIREAGGNILTSRLTHNGEGLSVSVIFVSEIAPTNKGLAKRMAVGDWTITVVADGYADYTYTLHPDIGLNSLQDITLHPIPDGEYAVTIFAGINATGSGSYEPGTTVNINAGEVPFGYKFNNWTTESSNVNFVSANSATTNFIMPTNAVIIKANFEVIPKYAVTVSSTGTGALGSGSYMEGSTVSVTAGTAPAGQRFKNWTTTSASVIFADSTNATTTFTMPSNAVTVTANFGANTYTVTVSAGIDAIGGGDYSPGTTVSITAGTHSDGLPFRRWVSSNSNVVFNNANSATTTFTMPAVAVTATAVFGASFTDERDGKIYGVTTINNQTWMSENLNYQTTGGSWCYGDDNSMCDKYGRLYDWNTALAVCPSGWRLASHQDWRNLVIFANNGSGNPLNGDGGGGGRKLKSTNGWNNHYIGTDDFGFSALPGGNRYTDGRFNDGGSEAYWWTATETETDGAYRRRTAENNVDEYEDPSIGNGYSVRCVNSN